MNKKNLLLLTLMSCIYPMAVFAAIECEGIPNRTKVGEFGAQEKYSYVSISGKDYRLGETVQDDTKARLALASTALVSDKNLLLRFYREPTCDSASANRTIPNSVQLVR